MWVVGIPLFAVVVLFAAGCLIAVRHIFSKWGSLNARQRLHALTVFLAVTVFVGGFVNFAAFFTVAVAIGGDAVAGRVEGGRYYVSSHGRLTEVSRGVWEYSLFHARSTWITHPLAALAMLVLLLSGRLFAVNWPSALTVCVTPEGSLRVGAEEVTVAEAVTRAEATRARRQAVFVRRDYPPGEPPPEAVRLCHELVERNILFRTVDGSHPA